MSYKLFCRCKSSLRCNPAMGCSEGPEHPVLQGLLKEMLVCGTVSHQPIYNGALRMIIQADVSRGPFDSRSMFGLPVA